MRSWTVTAVTHVYKLVKYIVAKLLVQRCQDTGRGDQTLSFLAQGEQLFRQARGLQLER